MYIHEKIYLTSFSDFKKYAQGSQINCKNLLLTVYEKIQISRKASGYICCGFVLKKKVELPITKKINSKTHPLKGFFHSYRVCYHDVSRSLHPRTHRINYIHLPIFTYYIIHFLNLDFLE